MSVTGTSPNFTLGVIPPSINTVTRTTNSTYTISPKQATLYYSVTCTVTNPLLIGTSTATAFLEYSTNGGSTWTSANTNGASSGVGITVTIQLTSGQTGGLIGVVPGGATVRVRTTTTGSASVSSAVGQEVY